MSLVEKIKSDLLSISAVVVSMLHIFMIVGAVTCWIGFQDMVLGNDVMSMIGKR